jgi:hypothetical protein
MTRGVKTTTVVKMRVKTGRRYCTRCWQKSETRLLGRVLTITIRKAEKMKRMIII